MQYRIYLMYHFKPKYLRYYYIHLSKAEIEVSTDCVIGIMDIESKRKPNRTFLNNIWYEEEAAVRYFLAKANFFIKRERDPTYRKYKKRTDAERVCDFLNWGLQQGWNKEILNKPEKKPEPIDYSVFFGD